MRYLQVTVRCAPGVAELVADRFTEATGGAEVLDPSVVEAALREGRWDATDLMPDPSGLATVRGYLPETEDWPARYGWLRRALARLRRLRLGPIGPVRTRWVAEEDWAEAWKAYFHTLEVSPFRIVPSWEVEALGPKPGPGPAPLSGADRSQALPIYLDPGMAFGTGQHPTTALCLRWLGDLLSGAASATAGGPGGPLVAAPGETGVTGSRVRRAIDLGTGSGILAIALVRLGVPEVLALDVDPVAVCVARDNVAHNGVGGQVVVAHGSLDGPDARRWLGAGPADLVVANLTASLLAELAVALAGALRPGGLLVASGIVAERRGEVLSSLAGAGFTALAGREDSGWLAMLFRK